MQCIYLFIHSKQIESETRKLETDCRKSDFNLNLQKGGNPQALQKSSSSSRQNIHTQMDVDSLAKLFSSQDDNLWTRVTNLFPIF